MAAATFPFWWMFLMRIGRLSWLALLSVAGCGAVPNVTLAAEAETDKPATGRYFSLFLNHLTHVTANTVGAQQNYYGLSLIHISEPTRPY